MGPYWTEVEYVGAAHAHDYLQAQALIYKWLVQCFPTNHVQRFPQACTHNFHSHPGMFFWSPHAIVMSNLLTLVAPHTMNIQTHVLSCSFTTKCILSKRTHYKITTAIVSRASHNDPYTDVTNFINSPLLRSLPHSLPLPCLLLHRLGWPLTVGLHTQGQACCWYGD